MSTTTIMPDPNTAIGHMTIEQIQAELAAYRPGTAAEVIAIEAYMTRRARLWRRVDELLCIRRPAIARPVTG